jgi:hypothetical protein
MILFFERYSSSDPARAAELEEARGANAAAGLFERIVPVSDGRRKTFADLFALAAAGFSGEVCVLANGDIAFDASLRGAEAWLRRFPGPALVALTRWDDPAGPSMEGRIDAGRWRFFSHSQDSWLFLAGGLPSFEAAFTLGVPACENRLVYEAHAAGVTIFNPALSVRTWHHHASAVRSWKAADAYRGPLYFPRLTTLEAEAGEGFVLERSGWRTRKEVVGPARPVRN